MAQEKYGFFNGTVEDERHYDAEDMATAFRVFAIDGVAVIDDACLKVTAEGSTMRTLIGYGMAFVQGYWYILRNDGDGAYTVTHGAANGLNRIDRIVLRLDLSTRTITLVKLIGVAASAPVAAALTRNSEIYELGLAQVLIRAGATEILAEDVTDERADEDVCGTALPAGLKFSNLWNSLMTYTPGIDVLRYAAQALTAEQKAQGRANLGAQARVDTLGLLKGMGVGGVLAAIPGQDYAKATRLAATLTAAGWTGSGPYTQTVAVAGILATDTPTVDVVLSAVAVTAQAQLEAYAYIGRIVAGAGTITATCYEELPEVDLTLTLQVVHGNADGDASTDLTADMVATSEAGVSVQAKLTELAAGMQDLSGAADALHLAEALIQEGTPQDSATGEGVEIYPLPGSPLTVTVHAVAAQDGSGTPALENRRTLTGRAAVTVHHGATDHTLTPQTPLYGVAGAEDAIDNLGAVSHRTVHVVFNGTESWSLPSSSAATATEARFYRAPTVALAATPHGACDAFPWDGAIDLTPAVWGEKIGKLATSANLQLIVLKSRLAGWSDAWTATQKTNALKAFLAAQNALGTPVQMVYECAVPVSETAAVVPIAAVDGANTLSADAGAVTVDYSVSVPHKLTEMSDEFNARLAVVDTTCDDYAFHRATWRDRVADEQQKNDFRWNTPFDKAYVTFTFDDLSDDVNIVADVFAAAGVPVCLSVPPSRLPTLTQSGETGLEVCQRVVANGGEILAHSFSYLTSASTDADYEAILVDTKRQLAAAGFNAQGIIESGNGGDELTADYEKAVRYLRPYYRYSDAYGRDTGVEQYENLRTYLKTTTAANHAAVDTAVANHAWLIFASHRIDLTTPTSIGTTRALVEDVLSYITGLGAPAVEVVTFAGMYDKFRSSVLERAVAALQA